MHLSHTGSRFSNGEHRGFGKIQRNLCACKGLIKVYNVKFCRGCFILCYFCLLWVHFTCTIPPVNAIAITTFANFIMLHEIYLFAGKNVLLCLFNIPKVKYNASLLLCYKNNNLYLTVLFVIFVPFI